MADDSFSSFPRRIRARAKQLENSVSRAIRSVALAADRAAVQATPVDTGNARSNWNVTVRVPKITVDDNTEIGGTGPATQKALAKARSAVVKFRLRDGVIWLTNGVSYIRRLDQGYSSKGGFMTDAALLAGARAARIALKKGIFK